MEKLKSSFIIFSVLLLSIQVQAQYFGKNKASYKGFEFEVSQSPHFEIHHYLKDTAALHDFATHSEHWYCMHQRVLNDTIRTKNPIILYNDHADFQQTNAINSAVSVGTGGVTEAFKNRVIMPFGMSNQQTHHVLGHELVHAFQYNMILNGDSTSLRNLSNLPLWLVEGLAEYMSIGSVDAHTAMWMRDAVFNEDVPSLDDLNNPKYFPYRYGHAFWAFLTGLKGDKIIEPFFVGVAKYGFETAAIRVLGMSKENLSALWQQGLKRHFGAYTLDKEKRTVGKPIINKENAGQLNVAPVISPNGRYVIFLSEKELFSIDLYLANARTGKIIRKVASSTKDGHIDDFNYIESAGTWSPKSTQFAYVAFSKGKNILVIKEVKSGKTIKEFPIKDVPAFSNPSWSPDGKSIVVTGLVEGRTNLYQVNIKTGRVKQLTKDAYAQIHARWSPDGSTILFSTDEWSHKNGRTHGKWTFNLAELDVASGEITPIEIFLGADNMNALYDKHGNIYFLSNRDGFRNLYKYDVLEKKVYQMTDLITGISGITPYAPAISLAQRIDRIVYTHYNKNQYDIYQAPSTDFLNREVDPKAIDWTAAKLLRVNPKANNLVDAQLNEIDQLPRLKTDQVVSIDYQPKFKLDYIGGSAGLGIGSNQLIGNTTGVAGGVDLLFSDILGNNQLFTSISLNGELEDIGGVVGYFNRKNRINWGGSISHIPSRNLSGGYVGQTQLPIDDEGNTITTNQYRFFQRRFFEQKASVFGQLPFSKTLRLEAGAAFSRYSFQLEQLDNYYDRFGRLIFQERDQLTAPPGFNLWNVNAAFVGDNASFGITAPLHGERFRIGVEQYFGEFSYTAATADYRIYRFYKPVGFAFRALHYGRYGNAADNDLLFPLYAGNPRFVRGYNGNGIQDIFAQNQANFDDLLGSKVLVTNFEMRIPFTGPKRLALIKSNFLLTDLNFFVDAGLAFNQFSDFGDKNKSLKPIASAGTSVRINLFGALILEPYYAIPFEKNTKGIFGLNIIPGW